jgi:carbon-monoxide dehydrogenase medium subunit
MAGVALRAKFTGNTMIDPCFVFFGVGEKPVVAERAMVVAAGKQAVPATISAVQAALDADLDPPADLHGSPQMKRHLARVLLARGLSRMAGAPEARAA